MGLSTGSAKLSTKRENLVDVVWMEYAPQASKGQGGAGAAQRRVRFRVPRARTEGGGVDPQTARGGSGWGAGARSPYGGGRTKMTCGAGGLCRRVPADCSPSRAARTRPAPRAHGCAERAREPGPGGFPSRHGRRHPCAAGCRGSRARAAARAANGRGRTRGGAGLRRPSRGLAAGARGQAPPPRLHERYNKPCAIPGPKPGPWMPRPAL